VAGNETERSVAMVIAVIFGKAKVRKSRMSRVFFHKRAFPIDDEQDTILLKNPRNALTRLSMNGKSLMISTTPPFVLRLSKDERRGFSA